MTTMQEFAEGHSPLETLLLGSVTKEDVIVEGRAINQHVHISDGSERASASIWGITSRLGLPQSVHTEALVLWRRVQRGRLRKRKQNVLELVVWIAARLYEREIEPEEVCQHLSRRPQGFLRKAHILAEELGVELPSRNHDAIMLRAVDELGLSRDFYHMVKRLYPKARVIRGGDPRNTMAAILYSFVRSKHKQGEIAASFGLREYSVRETYDALKAASLFPCSDIQTQASLEDREAARLAKLRLETGEMRRIANVLLDNGVSRKSVYRMLLGLHPERGRRCINSLVYYQNAKRSRNNSAAAAGTAGA